MTHSDIQSPTTSHSDSTTPPLSDDFALIEQSEDNFDMLASQEWSDGHSRASSTSERMKLSFPDPLTPEPIADETAYSFLLDVSSTSPPSSDSPRSVTSSLPSTDFAQSHRAESQAEEPPADVPSTPPELEPKERAISDWLKLTDEARAAKEEHEQETIEAEVEQRTEHVQPKRQVKRILKIASEALPTDEPLLEQILDRIERVKGIKTIGLGAGNLYEQPGVIIRLVSCQEDCKPVSPSMEATYKRTNGAWPIKVLPLLVTPPSTQSSFASIATNDSNVTIRGVQEVKAPGITLLALDSPEPNIAEILTADQFRAADDEQLREAFEELLIDEDDVQQTKPSVFSRAFLLLAAALVIATTALLETSPSFSSLRPVQEVVQQAPPPVTSIADASPTPIPTLPPAEPRALIDAAPLSTCSLGQPGACALAVIDGRTSPALFAPKLSAPSLFGSPVKVNLKVKKRHARRFITRQASRPKIVVERRVVRKNRRARVRIDQGTSFRDALKLASKSFKRGAHQLAQPLKNRITPSHLLRLSSTAHIVSHRVRRSLEQGARLAVQHSARLQEEGRAVAAVYLDKASREGVPKLRKLAAEGEEQLRRGVQVGSKKLAEGVQVGDQHLRAASTRASRHLSDARVVAKKQGARIRQQTTRIGFSALKLGRHHLIRAASALEALQNGEVDRSGVKSCASLESEDARTICLRRRRRQREREVRRSRSD